MNASGGTLLWMGDMYRTNSSCSNSPSISQHFSRCFESGAMTGGRFRGLLFLLAPVFGGIALRAQTASL